MKVTLSIKPRTAKCPHRSELTSEDINIIYTALLQYNKNFADKGRTGQSYNVMSRYKMSERIRKLSEVFMRCGGEADNLYAI